MRIPRHIGTIVLLAAAVPAQAQTALTWQQVKDRFLANNPTLQAGEIGIQESKAGEITANLRPNPDFSVLVDQLQPFPGTGVPYRPLSLTFPSVAFGYLQEREHKPELRLQSAQLNLAAGREVIP